MSRSSLAISTAFVTLFTAGTAQADVSADDVWRNIRAYIDAFGGTLDVDTARSGDTLNVGDFSLSWNLPFDAGTFTLSESGFDIVELGDGTVRVDLPDRIDVDLHVEPTGKPPVRFAMAIVHQGLSMTASGQPDDIIYVTSASEMRMSLTDLQVPDVDDPDAEMEMVFADLAAETRMKTGETVIVDGKSSIGSQDFRFTFSDAEGANVESSGKADSATGTFAMTLPRNGMDILNLAAALRGGLSFKIDSTMQNYETHQVVNAGGQTISEQHNTVGTYDLSMRLDEEGLNLDGAAQDNTLRILMPDAFPLEMSFTADLAKGRMMVPVSAGDELQDAALSMEMSGVTVGEELWGLVDPGQTIPRDPATVRFDIAAQVKSYLNWLDFMAVGASMDAGERPGELHGLTLKNLTVEAAGASLSGSGTASFDNSDLETFNGFPKPTGTLDMTLKGANALIDRLMAIGLLSEDDAMGARLGMGMVAKPAPEEGEDVLKSHIELNAEGQVLANGIRIR